MNFITGGAEGGLQKILSIYLSRSISRQISSAAHGEPRRRRASTISALSNPNTRCSVSISGLPNWLAMLARVEDYAPCRFRITFKHALSLGRRVIWLHTFGDRMVDPADRRIFSRSKQRGFGDRKCIGKSRKSFVGHPGAILFLLISRAGVSQQPRDFSPTDKRNEQVGYAGKKRGPDSEIESSRSLNRS
jgi:hypothetical protein